MKKLIVIAAVILGFTSTSFAQISVNSKAVIVSTLSIANNNNMDFGSLMATAAGGSAVLSASSANAISGTILPQTGNVAKAAKFTITGAGGSPKITFPATVPLTGPGTAMSLALNCRIDGGTTDLVSATTAIPFIAGSATVYMGGTLTVGANQTAGNYQSADFQVTVAY
jgi:hypothetical protein